MNVNVLYQDKYLFICEKPVGIPSESPGLPDLVFSQTGRKAYPVHRLDQGTSGLMVLGLTQEAHDRLSSDFENRRVYKEYEALVDGLILQECGLVDLPMRLDVENRPHQIVDFEQGKAAITEWQKLSIENRYGRKVTRLKLIPKTGRTHQLRVHCAYGLNCPIIGDALYGQAPSGEIKRLMLQAKVLEFNQPVTGEPLQFVLDSEF